MTDEQCPCCEEKARKEAESKKLDFDRNCPRCVANLPPHIRWRYQDSPAYVGHPNPDFVVSMSAPDTGLSITASLGHAN